MSTAAARVSTGGRAHLVADGLRELARNGGRPGYAAVGFSKQRVLEGSKARVVNATGQSAGHKAGQAARQDGRRVQTIMQLAASGGARLRPKSDNPEEARYSSNTNEAGSPDRDALRRCGVLVL